jgi:hypothetical protein
VTAHYAALRGTFLDIAARFSKTAPNAAPGSPAASAPSGQRTLLGLPDDFLASALLLIRKREMCRASMACKHLLRLTLAVPPLQMRLPLAGQLPELRRREGEGRGWQLRAVRPVHSMWELNLLATTPPSVEPGFGGSAGRPRYAFVGKRGELHRFALPDREAEAGKTNIKHSREKRERVHPT